MVEDARGAHAKALGEMVMAYVELHCTMGDLYYNLAMPRSLDEQIYPTGKDAYDEWNEAKFERNQRNLLQKRAKERLKENRILLINIEKMIQSARALGKKRDEFVHSPYAILRTLDGQKVIVPHSCYQHPNAVNLQDRCAEGKLTQEVMQLTEDILALSRDIEALRRRVVDYQHDDRPEA